MTAIRNFVRADISDHVAMKRYDTQQRNEGSEAWCASTYAAYRDV